MAKKAIFIAATGQNVGKTTLCLGIIAALQKRFSKIGFIKPVGQQYVTVNDQYVDKDVVLFKEHFHLSSSYRDMSPVVIPQGFTRDYLNKQVTVDELKNKIRSAYNHIAAEHEYTVVEGTGHIGVGSIVELSNAQVAADLDLEMVIISSGGLGSAYDQLSLNLALCKAYGVRVRGVILNRVKEDKRDMISDYFPKALESWGIPLIGCIPYSQFLSLPTMQDFENLFKTSLLWGEKYRMRHFRHQHLVSGSLENFIDDDIRNELVITPASRTDIILATVQKHKDFAKQGIDGEGGLIITGRRPPSQEIIDHIRAADIPTIHAPICSYDAMKMITPFIAKIRNEDVGKVEQAIKLVEQNIDFEQLCKP